MEAFAESIMHLENLKEKRNMVERSLAAQGTSNGIEGYLKTIPTSKNPDEDREDDSDKLLRHFQARSKGVK